MCVVAPWRAIRINFLSANYSRSAPPGPVFFQSFNRRRPGFAKTFSSNVPQTSPGAGVTKIRRARLVAFVLLVCPFLREFFRHPLFERPSSSLCEYSAVLWGPVIFSLLLRHILCIACLRQIRNGGCHVFPPHPCASARRHIRDNNRADGGRAELRGLPIRHISGVGEKNRATDPRRALACHFAHRRPTSPPCCPLSKSPLTIRSFLSLAQLCPAG